MASVDEIVAALANTPAVERLGRQFADELSRLDEPVLPPERPIPAWFRQGVERRSRISPPFSMPGVALETTLSLSEKQFLA